MKSLLIIFAVFIFLGVLATLVPWSQDQKVSSEAYNLNEEASDLHSAGKYAEALPLYKRALAIREKTLGPEHPEVALSLNNLAELYRVQGEYAEALPLYKRSLAIAEKALGPEHPDVALSLNNLAELYRNTGRIEEAEVLERRVAKILAMPR